MSLKKAFTKMGLIEEEVTPKKPEASTAITPASPSPVLSYSLASSHTEMAPEVDKEIYARLQNSLQENKLSGFDYLKFVSAVDEMKTAGSPEDMRFKMAFFAAKQLGVDKNSLLKSGQHYIDVLSENEGNFGNDCAKFEKEELQAREAKIAELDRMVTQLNSQLADAMKQNLTLKAESAEKKNLLDSQKRSFQVTMESVKGEIAANMKKIDQYL